MTEVERIAHPMITAPDREAYAIMGALAQYPLGVISQLADSGTKFVAVPREGLFADSSPTMASWSDADRASGEKRDGLFVHADRTVYVRHAGTSLLVHEAAHALDMALGVGHEMRSSHDPTIQGEFKRAKERSAFITPKAAENAAEFFAEAVRAHVGTGRDVSREKLFDLHPHTCVLIDRCFARAERKLLNRNRWFTEAYHGLTEDGRSYTGEILDRLEGSILQDTGRGRIVSHATSDLDRAPSVGENVSICYDNGRGVVAMREVAEADISR